MRDWLFSLAFKFWPELKGAAQARQMVGVGEVLSFLYSLPLALLGLAWLAAVSDARQFRTQWASFVLLAVLLWVFARLRYFLITEIRAGRYGSSDGSLENMVMWTGLFLLGPNTLWIILLLNILELAWHWRTLQSKFDHWNRLRNLSFSLATNVFSVLIALSVYSRLGGHIPLADLSVSSLLPALAAIAIHFLLMLLIWTGYGVYATWTQITLAGTSEVRPVLRFLLLALALPALSQPFAILAAGLYSEHGSGSFLFFIIGLLMVALLTRQLGRAAEASRQNSRLLEQLERLGQELLKAAPDASNLGETLHKSLPTMFPPGHVCVWMNSDQILYLESTDWSFEPAPVWDWMQALTGISAYQSSQNLPWTAVTKTHNPVIVAPILDVEQGTPLGGIYIELFTLAQSWDTHALKSLFPAVQSLASQVASAIHQAEVYHQALAYQKVSQELTLAGKIQSSFLPNELPRMDGWQIAVTLLPARETSGDYFDLIPLSNNRMGILIADVTDKGVGAALYMALSRTLIRTFSVEFDDEEPQPELVFFSTNDRILQDAHADLFVTAFYGILDLQTGLLTYCNAGHPAPYLVNMTDGCNLQALASTGMPLGVEEDNLWKRASAQINPGDVLVLFTDGIPDAQNAQGEFFGDAPLIEAISGTAQKPPSEIQESILDRIRSFVGDAPQFDDITLMILGRDL